MIGMLDTAQLTAIIAALIFDRARAVANKRDPCEWAVSDARRIVSLSYAASRAAMEKR